MATNHSAIHVGQTHTVILGRRFPNTARIPASMLAASFGDLVPFPTFRDGSAPVRSVARALLRYRDIAISQLNNFSEEA
jgi:hypothetical protein